MTPFEVQGPTRTCALSGKELQPGERFFGVLLDDAGRFVRQDFALEGWNGPPPRAIAYWSGRIPVADRTQKPAINDAILLDWFDHLSMHEMDPIRRNFRYVVSLLLMRRKRMKFEDTRRLKDGIEILVLRDLRNGALVEVADPRLTEDDIHSVQEEVFRVLGW